MHTPIKQHVCCAASDAQEVMGKRKENSLLADACTLLHETKKKKKKNFKAHTREIIGCCN
jgi:hypothetical protein